MKKLLLALCCFTQGATQAQNGFTTYSCTAGTIGVLQKPTSMVIDNNGYKWIGLNSVQSTDPGLAKYDNSTWTLYSTTSVPALPSNKVNALAKDNAGNIWIGTNAGLVKYTGTTFVTFDMTDGLPSNTITCIEAIGSSVYVGTGSGLSRYDGLNFTNYTVANGKLPNDNITALKAENANLIWIGGVDRLVRFSINSSFTTTSFANNSISASPGKINCIHIDPQNTKWLGTTNVGVLMYSGSTFINATTTYTAFGGVIPNTVYDITDGLNNGVAFKMADAVSAGQNSGIIELAPNHKIYQYFYPTINKTGDYLEKQGLSLILSGTARPVSIVMYKLDKSGYTPQLGEVNIHNFKALDINKVNAGIANRGDMHWKISDAQPLYEVPKGSGKHSSFACGMWVSGLDNSNQLYGSFQTYREPGTGFWPGPLDTLSAATDSATALKYDKIWKLSNVDINDFITNFNNGNVQNNTYTPVEDLVSWPAKGTGNYSRNLAPFVDVNGNGVYDPLTGGDYPRIKGEQALYYIFNDKLLSQNNVCNAMGLEIHGMAYAYGCANIVQGKKQLDYTTFYEYKVINRSANNYHDVYIGLLNEMDIGYYLDDYIGSDVSGNYVYGYNADNFDETVMVSGQSTGYGAYPPAQGFAIVKGPLANTADGIDNDNDGIIDEAGEECKLNKAMTFQNTMPGVPVAQTYPETCQEHRNYLTGKWKDGTNLTCGGSGYGGTTATNWAYSGDPNSPGVNTDPANTCGYWTEATAGNVMQDRKGVIGSGPFQLNAGQVQEVAYAFITSFDSTSATNANLLAVNKLKNDVVEVNDFYNEPVKPVCSRDVGIRQLTNPDYFMVYPNPASSVITVHSTQGNVKTDVEMVDVLGKLILKTVSSVNDFVIPLTDLKPGIYFLRLKANGQTTVKKIIKE